MNVVHVFLSYTQTVPASCLPVWPIPCSTVRLTAAHRQHEPKPIILQKAHVLLLLQAEASEWHQHILSDKDQKSLPARSHCGNSLKTQHQRCTSKRQSITQTNCAAKASASSQSHTQIAPEQRKQATTSGPWLLPRKYYFYRSHHTSRPAATGNASGKQQAQH